MPQPHAVTSPRDPRLENPLFHVAHVHGARLTTGDHPRRADTQLGELVGERLRIAHPAENLGSVAPELTANCQRSHGPWMILEARGIDDGVVCQITCRVDDRVH